MRRARAAHSLSSLCATVSMNLQKVLRSCNSFFQSMPSRLLGLFRWSSSTGMRGNGASKGIHRLGATEGIGDEPSQASPDPQAARASKAGQEKFELVAVGVAQKY